MVGGRPVLFITHSDDTHADRVECVLRERDVPVARIDTDAWPPRWSVTVTADAGGVSFTLRVRNRSFSLRDVRSIYFRRVVDPSVDLLGDELRMLNSEREETINAILALYDGPTLGNPLRYRAVDNKVLHLALAAKLGIAVPRTILTSEPVAADAFVASGPSVMKLQRSVYLQRGEDRYAVYTTRVDEALRAHLPHVAAAPTLFQEEIQKQYELRITVVGKECFACRINSQASPLTQLDYRKYDFDHVEHTAYELPPLLAQQCIALVSATGMTFGALDFVRTIDGQYVFLDLNLNGQWLWTEELAGLPISAAIADYLS